MRSAFFLAIHDFSASTWNINRSADFFTATSGSGSTGTKIAFLLLGAYGAQGLLNRGRLRLRPRGLASLFAVTLLVWCLVSFLWAPSLTEPLGRLAGVAGLILTAIRLRRERTASEVIQWLTLTTTFYAALGLVTELVLGTFQPWDVVYRFSGTLHPNGQGVNCSIAGLGACCLAIFCPRRRRLWVAVAIFAFLLNLSTKSRTAILSLFLAGVLAFLFLPAQSLSTEALPSRSSPAHL